MIEVYWASSDQRVVRVDYYDPVETWEEYMAAVEKSFEMVASQTHTVHVIHNPGKASMPNGNAFFYLRRASNLIPDNCGQIIMVIANPFARRISEVMVRLLLDGRTYTFVDSLGQAYRFIVNYSREQVAER